MTTSPAYGPGGKSLVLVTTAAPVEGEAVLLNRMFAAGLSRLYLRKPDWTGAAVARLLGQVEKEYRDRVMVSFASLQGHAALFPDCRNIHFPEVLREEIKPGYLEALRNRGYVLSTSVHARTALDTLPEVFSSAFFGPVFDSISKPGYRALPVEQLDVSGYRGGLALIALGGIRADNCRQALQYGFDGVAVSGAVWQHQDPVTAFKQIQLCLTNDR